jgi:DNA-binding XRE family transcriptional regulator
MLAEAAGISSRYMIAIEKGQYGPSFKKLEALALALNVEVKDLFDFPNT